MFLVDYPCCEEELSDVLQEGLAYDGTAVHFFSLWSVIIHFLSLCVYAYSLSSGEFDRKTGSLLHLSVKYEATVG